LRDTASITRYQHSGVSRPSGTRDYASITRAEQPARLARRTIVGQIRKWSLPTRVPDIVHGERSGHFGAATLPPRARGPFFNGPETDGASLVHPADLLDYPLAAAGPADEAGSNGKIGRETSNSHRLVMRLCVGRSGRGAGAGQYYGPRLYRPNGRAACAGAAAAVSVYISFRADDRFHGEISGACFAAGRICLCARRADFGREG
jgi:hypothetical protein